MLAPAVIRCLVLMLCGAGAIKGGAQDGPAAAVAARPDVTTSSSGRFVVTGPDAAKTREYTHWAEAMAERVERRLGMPLAFTRQSPLRIHLAPADSSTAGIVVQCQYREGRLSAGLTVNEYAALDYEDLLAALCRLALVAVVDRERGPRGAGGGPPRVPSWLAVGLAQNLDPALCARNRRLVHGTLPDSEPPEVSAVLSWDNLPERWYRTRALCGMTVMWLDSLKEQGESWRRIVDRLAAGEPVTAGWVAQSLAGVNSGAALETRWSAWLKRQERVVQDLGAVSSVMLGQLRERVEVSASELGDAAPDDGDRRLAPLDLVAMRRRAAVRLVAEERMQQVQALTIGKAPELVRVGQLYAFFYEGLVRGSAAWRLRWRLRQAEREWVALSELTRARETYVDAFEREAASTGGPAVLTGPSPALDKSPLEAYVDDVEKRFGRTGND